MAWATKPSRSYWYSSEKTSSARERDRLWRQRKPWVREAYQFSQGRGLCCLDAALHSCSEARGEALLTDEEAELVTRCEEDEQLEGFELGE